MFGTYIVQHVLGYSHSHGTRSTPEPRSKSGDVVPQLQLQKSLLEYTDDMTLVAVSWEDLRAMLQSLDEK